jgi:hypothetical protein
MSNNLHEKATLYLVIDLWAYERIEVCNVTWRFDKYAQFTNAVRLEYTLRGKRKRQTRIITTNPLVVLGGWDHPLPPPKYDQPKRNSGQGDTIFVKQTTRYLSADPKWDIEFDAFLHEYLERSKARVILDLRKHDPTKSRSDVENQYLCEPVQDIPSNTKLHIWKKARADHNSSAEGSDWHAKVRLSDRPYYLDLYWRKTANDPAVQVGVFRLDLVGLLSKDYIRRESEDSQVSEVRLRFFRANNGNVYVQTKQDKPGLFIGVSSLNLNEGQSPLVQENSAIEDIPLAPIGSTLPSRTPTAGFRYQRDEEVRRFVIEQAKGACEYCCELGFLLPDGSHYLEAHHIIALAKQGPDTVDNVIALCPSDHREAHYGKKAIAMENQMVEIIKNRKV